MPPIVLTIIGIVQLAIKYAPEAEQVYEKAKALFQMWFEGGVITAAQQQALREWADAHQAATLAGEVPPEFTVEPDPS